MAKLFLHFGVFMLITLVVAAVCFWFVRLEERKSARRGS